MIAESDITCQVEVLHARKCIVGNNCLCRR